MSNSSQYPKNLDTQEIRKIIDEFKLEIIDDNDYTFFERESIFQEHY